MSQEIKDSISTFFTTIGIIVLISVIFYLVAVILDKLFESFIFYLVLLFLWIVIIILITIQHHKSKHI